MKYSLTFVFDLEDDKVCPDCDENHRIFELVANIGESIIDYLETDVVVTVKKCEVENEIEIH